jgi:endonuclease-3 related protein
MSVTSDLLEMYKAMFDRFGPQHWWPGETAIEIVVGAVLTQNTSWKNVEKAIGRLSERGLLSLKALHSSNPTELADAIRPAGYYNIKAKRLKNLVGLIASSHGEDLEGFLSQETHRLREALLSVKGIGPETADSILLYAGGHPVFVVDAYTFRILSRHGMCDETAAYQELQDLFMDHLPHETALFNEFHALIVRTAKEFCAKTPRCAQCPLFMWGRTRPDGQG